MRREKLNLAFDQALLAWLRVEAKKDNRSLTNFIENCLLKYKEDKRNKKKSDLV